MFQAKKIKRFVSNSQHGFTMVELGLVLVVSAIVLVGVISKFSVNSTTTQADQLTGDLTSLMGKVKSAYANNYAAVTNAKLDTGGFFRGLISLNDNAGAVTTNLGGGTLTVSSGTVTTAGDSVSYVMTQVPDAACLPIATALSKTATKLLIGTNVVKAPGVLPDPSKVICSGDSNTVTLLIQ